METLDSSGHLGTVTSSKRFKEEIRQMKKTSEAIFSLEPVIFRYSKQIDPAGTSQFGFMRSRLFEIATVTTWESRLRTTTWIQPPTG